MRSLPVFLSFGLLLALACGGGDAEEAAVPDRGLSVTLEAAEEAAAEEVPVEEVPVEEAEAAPAEGDAVGDATETGGLGLVGAGRGGGGAATGAGIGTVSGKGAAGPAGGGGDALDWLDALPDSAIQYNRPQEVPFGGAFQVGLVIDITGDQEAAGATLYGMREAHPGMVGETMAVDAPTGDEVEVTLLGSNAKIEPLEPERQRVSGRQPARWRWNITPEGPRDIELNLSVLAIEPGRQNGLKIESYSDTIHVRVTGLQRAQLWAADNWEWAWTFLGAPVVAFGWSRVQRRRREQGGAAED